MLKSSNIKRIFLFTTLVLTFSVFLFSCRTDLFSEGSTSESTTTENYISSPIKQTNTKVMIKRGLWAPHEDTERHPNGFYSRWNDGYLFTDDTANKLQLSMKTATYTPIEQYSRSICEFFSLEFLPPTENASTIAVYYLYDYEADKVICIYGDKWYQVENYDLLVSDVTELSKSYTYEKYVLCTKFTAKDGTVYDSIYVNTRFFARETGFDNSIYSGFVNTEKVEEMNSEKAKQLAVRELSNLTKNADFMFCNYDPLSGYWNLTYTDNNCFWDVYLNENGCTVQITPTPSKILG